MRNFTLLLFLIICLISIPSCENDKTNNHLLSGDMYQDTIEFELAVYYLGKPNENPEIMLSQLLENDSTNLILLLKDTVQKHVPSVTIRKVNNILKDYSPPDSAMLKYFGYGMSEKQKRLIQKPKDLLILDFFSCKEDIWDTYRKALNILYELAHENFGIIWDEESRACYTPKEWKARRLDSWESKVPTLAKHCVIHYYRDSEFCRAVTLGMGKFGLPDIALNKLSCYQDKSTSSLINLLCQVLAEKENPINNGMIELDIDRLKNRSLKDEFLNSLDKGAIKKLLYN